MAGPPAGPGTQARGWLLADCHRPEQKKTVAKSFAGCLCPCVCAHSRKQAVGETRKPVSRWFPRLHGTGALWPCSVTSRCPSRREKWSPTEGKPRIDSLPRHCSSPGNLSWATAPRGDPRSCSVREHVGGTNVRDLKRARVSDVAYTRGE